MFGNTNYAWLPQQTKTTQPPLDWFKTKQKPPLPNNWKVSKGNRNPQSWPIQNLPENIPEHLKNTPATSWKSLTIPHIGVIKTGNVIKTRTRYFKVEDIIVWNVQPAAVYIWAVPLKTTQPQLAIPALSASHLTEVQFIYPNVITNTYRLSEACTEECHEVKDHIRHKHYEGKYFIRLYASI